jgi:hypothetical protein
MAWHGRARQAVCEKSRDGKGADGPSESSSIAVDDGQDRIAWRHKTGQDTVGGGKRQGRDSQGRGTGSRGGDSTEDVERWEQDYRQQ